MSIAVRRSDLPFCEACGGQFPESLMNLAADGRVLCRTCNRSATVHEHADDISYAKKWMPVAVVAGLLPFTWPLSVPLTIRVVRRCARALGKPRAWLWITGASIPWVGLLVMTVLDGHCTRAMQRAGLIPEDGAIPEDLEAYMTRMGEPFRPVERLDFERLLRLNHFGDFLFVANWALAFVLSGFVHASLGAIGLAGVGLKAWTWSKLRPYRRHLQEFYGENDRFKEKPSALYEKRLLGEDRVDRERTWR